MKKFYINFIVLIFVSTLNASNLSASNPEYHNIKGTKYIAVVNGYYSDRKNIMRATSKISIDDAINKVKGFCKDSPTMNKGKPEGCLIWQIIIYDGFKKVYEKNIWDEQVANYEKSKKTKQTATVKINIESMITKAKDTCKSLGFKEGTEKFSDCSLKLYTQSVQIAAEQKKSVVMQPQSSGSSVMTIYDPVRDSRALMQQGQRMLSGACTLGINC